MKTHHLKQTTSTMDELKALARKGAIAGTVVFADVQNNGRGQQGRIWFGDENSLMFSILYRPQEPVKDVKPIVQMVSNAVISGLEEFIDIQVELEWPNDLIIGNEKVGGILIESSSQGEKIHYIIAGIGVNLNNTKFPSALEQTASSLKLKTGREFDKLELLDVLVTKLRHVNNN